MFTKGTRVRQVAPVIEGEIDATRFNEGAQQLEYHVAYTGADGEPSARWFLEPELEPADAAPAA